MKVYIGMILAGLALAASPLTHHAPNTDNPFAHACKTEDSNGCYWNAKTRGNGQGKSFVVTKAGNVFYFDPSMSRYPNKPFHK